MYRFDFGVDRGPLNLLVLDEPCAFMSSSRHPWTSYCHIRLFDLSLDVEEAEQEYHLQAELPSRPGTQPLARAVGFAFGGEHLWDRFTVRTELIAHFWITSNTPPY